ncbi:MAG: hypothetical protein V4593_00520 [Pseudomonadota bacterium]
MKKFHFAFALGAGILLSPLASAAEGTFCSSAVTTGNPGNDKMIYTCGNGMKGTLPELYKLGWRAATYHVYQSADVTNDRTYAVIVLEKL